MDKQQPCVRHNFTACQGQRKGRRMGRTQTAGSDEPQEPVPWPVREVVQAQSPAQQQVLQVQHGEQLVLV
jgi:hypothetical protein